MRQNYTRCLLNLPKPQMLTYDQQQRSARMTGPDAFIFSNPRMTCKPALSAQELDRRLLKSVMFGPRYMTRGTLNPAPVGRVLMEMSYADLERRARDVWESCRIGAPFFTKELNDNAWGGGL